jgi:hypothetical protein
MRSSGSVTLKCYDIELLEEYKDSVHGPYCRISLAGIFCGLFKDHAGTCEFTRAV